MSSDYKTPLREGYGGQQGCGKKEKESKQAVSGKWACWSAFLKCLHTDAHGMENKYKLLEISVQFQGCSLAGIREMWWDGSRVWECCIVEIHTHQEEEDGKLELYVRTTGILGVLLGDG